MHRLMVGAGCLDMLELVNNVALWLAQTAFGDIHDPCGQYLNRVGVQGDPLFGGTKRIKRKLTMFLAHQVDGEWDKLWFIRFEGWGSN